MLVILVNKLNNKRSNLKCITRINEQEVNQEILLETERLLSL